MWRHRRDGRAWNETLSFTDKIAIIYLKLKPRKSRQMQDRSDLVNRTLAMNHLRATPIWAMTGTVERKTKKKLTTMMVPLIVKHLSSWKKNLKNHPRHDSWSHKMKCIMSNPFTTIILIKIPSPNGFSCQANKWSSLFQGYPNCWSVVVALHAAFVDASEEEIIVHSQCKKEATGWIHHRPLQPTCSCEESHPATCLRFGNLWKWLGAMVEYRYELYIFGGNPKIPNYQVKLLLDLGSLD